MKKELTNVLKVLLAITVVLVDMPILSFAGSLASMPNDIAVVTAWVITVSAAVLNYIVFKLLFNNKKQKQNESNK